MRRELGAAGLLDATSDLELSGVLLRNDVNAWDATTGVADLEASFAVQRAGTVLYEQVKSAHHEWASYRTATDAIPAAVWHYPVAVGKLIKALVSDPDFQKTLRK